MLKNEDTCSTNDDMPISPPIPSLPMLFIRPYFVPTNPPLPMNIYPYTTPLIDTLHSPPPPPTSAPSECARIK